MMNNSTAAAELLPKRDAVLPRLFKYDVTISLLVRATLASGMWVIPQIAPLANPPNQAGPTSDANCYENMLMPLRSTYSTLCLPPPCLAYTMIFWLSSMCAGRLKFSWGAEGILILAAGSCMGSSCLSFLGAELHILF